MARQLRIQYAGAICHLWLFADGMRLRALESGAGKIAEKRRAIAKVSLEQLSKLFAKQTETGAMAALRSLVGRAWTNEGEPAIAAGICSENGASAGGTQRSRWETDSRKLVKMALGAREAVLTAPTAHPRQVLATTRLTLITPGRLSSLHKPTT